MDGDSSTSAAGFNEEEAAAASVTVCNGDSSGPTSQSNCTAASGSACSQNSRGSERGACEQSQPTRDEDDLEEEYTNSSQLSSSEPSSSVSSNPASPVPLRCTRRGGVATAAAATAEDEDDVEEDEDDEDHQQQLIGPSVTTSAVVAANPHCLDSTFDRATAAEAKGTSTESVVAVGSPTTTARSATTSAGGADSAGVGNAALESVAVAAAGPPSSENNRQRGGGVAVSAGQDDGAAKLRSSKYSGGGAGGGGGRLRRPWAPTTTEKETSAAAETVPKGRLQMMLEYGESYLLHLCKLDRSRRFLHQQQQQAAAAAASSFGSGWGAGAASSSGAAAGSSCTSSSNNNNKRSHSGSSGTHRLMMSMRTRKAQQQKQLRGSSGRRAAGARAAAAGGPFDEEECSSADSVVVDEECSVIGSSRSGGAGSRGVRAAAEEDEKFFSEEDEDESTSSRNSSRSSSSSSRGKRVSARTAALRQHQQQQQQQQRRRLSSSSSSSSSSRRRSRAAAAAGGGGGAARSNSRNRDVEDEEEAEEVYSSERNDEEDLIFEEGSSGSSTVKRAASGRRRRRSSSGTPPPCYTRLTTHPSILKCAPKPYQLEGLNWLINLHERGMNGILADEMGLGKTYQTISLLAFLKESKNIHGPHLVLAPKSTIGNWMTELRRFCPSLNAVKVLGDRETRRFVLQHVVSRTNAAAAASAVSTSERSGDFYNANEGSCGDGVVDTTGMSNTLLQDEELDEGEEAEDEFLNKSSPTPFSNNGSSGSRGGGSATITMMTAGGRSCTSTSSNSSSSGSHSSSSSTRSSGSNNSSSSSGGGDDGNMNSSSGGNGVGTRGGCSSSNSSRSHIHNTNNSNSSSIGSRGGTGGEGRRKATAAMFVVGSSRNQQQANIEDEEAAAAARVEAEAAAAGVVAEEEEDEDEEEVMVGGGRGGGHNGGGAVNGGGGAGRIITASSSTVVTGSGVVAACASNSSSSSNNSTGVRSGATLTGASAGGAGAGELLVLPDRVDVVVTSYEMCILEKAQFMKVEWEYIIIDEAHRIKNESSKLAQTVRLFSTQHRLLLTGTPLQNNLRELWALLNFLFPSLFASAAEFEHLFDLTGTSNTGAAAEGGNGAAALTPEEREERNMEIVTRLHRILRPFMLRRVKKEVLKEMPPKKELLLFVPLSAMQKQLYKDLLTKNVTALQGGDGAGRTQLLNLAMQLRKACNHPYLFEGYECEQADPFGEHVIENAGKLRFCDRLLKRLILEEQRRCLVFTQMTKMLDILEDYCRIRHFAYCRIDGNTSGDDRDRQIEEFNKHQSAISLFLLSTRAGGLGINLASADTVILYDSDWNPQVDLQAMDRVHRIGQKSAVNVYRLVHEHTIEEKIIEKATLKLQLDTAIIQQGRLSDQHNQSKQLSKNELMTMVQFGADHIFKSGSDNDLTEEDLEAILARGQERTDTMNEKLQTHVKKSLLDFSINANTSSSLYEYDGVDYTEQQRKADREAWAALAVETLESQNDRESRRRQRLLKEQDFNRQQLAAENKKLKHVPRAVRLPPMQEWQFYRRQRIEELHARELLYYRTQGASEALTEELKEEKRRLLNEGFGHWGKRDFIQFVRGNEMYGRDDLVRIATEVDGKSYEEIVAYSKVFWSRYEEIQGWEKWIRRIEEGEAVINKRRELEHVISRRQQQCEAPWRRLPIPYGGAAKSRSVFNEEEDRWILNMTTLLGYGNWFKMRELMVRDCQWRFDWFMRSRSASDIGKRAEALIRLLRKEEGERFTRGRRRLDLPDSRVISPSPCSSSTAAAAASSSTPAAASGSGRATAAATYEKYAGRGSLFAGNSGAAAAGAGRCSINNNAPPAASAALTALQGGGSSYAANNNGLPLAAALAATTEAGVVDNSAFAAKFVAVGTAGTSAINTGRSSRTSSSAGNMEQSVRGPPYKRMRGAWAAA